MLETQCCDGKPKNRLVRLEIFLKPKVEFMIKKTGAGVVIYSLNKSSKELRYLMLLCSRFGYWGFPKGTSEEGEDSKTTALRELKEETGINRFSLEDSFKEKISHRYTWPGSGLIEKEVTFFLGHSYLEEVEISWEHNKFLWMPYYEAKQVLGEGAFVKVLDKAQEFILESHF